MTPILMSLSLILFALAGDPALAYKQNDLTLPCSAESVDLSTARSLAIADCVKAAAFQLTHEWSFKSQSFETERDAGLLASATTNQQISGLSCEPSNEKVMETKDSVRVNLQCTFNLRTVKFEPVTKEKIGKKQSQTVSINSVPPCESVVVQGENSARVVNCTGNPFLIGLKAGEGAVLVRAKGYPPQEIQLSGSGDETLNFLFSTLGKEADPILGYYCQNGRPVHRFSGFITYDLPSTAGLPTDQAASRIKSAMEDLRWQAKQFEVDGKVFTDYDEVVKKAIGAPERTKIFKEYYLESGVPDLTDAQADELGNKLTIRYLTENFIPVVPPEKLDEVYGESVEKRSHDRNEAERTFRDGQPVASKILEFRVRAWYLAFQSATALNEKVSEDGKRVTFQATLDLKRLCPYIWPKTAFQADR